MTLTEMARQIEDEAVAAVGGQHVADRIMEASLTRDAVLLGGTCEWCAADVESWLYRNGYTVCPECKQVN